MEPPVNSALAEIRVPVRPFVINEEVATAVDSANDHDLMLAVREGDIDQLGELFERHHRPLYGFFVHLTGDRTSSEDLVQLVFYRILKYRHIYGDEGRFSAWIYHIARKVAADHFRRAGAASAPTDPEELPEMPDQRPHAAEQAARADENALLHAALAALPAALLPARPAGQFAFACLLLAGGVFLGGRLLNRPAPADADAATARELAELRKQVDTMGQLVGYSLIQQQSTSERLKAVFATLDRQQPDQQAVGNLLGALAFDPSTNVRLSALEALFPLASQAVVRTAVAASLPRDPSPLVQVAMIDFLAATRDPAATSAIEKVTRGETYDQSVRDAARRALTRM